MSGLLVSNSSVLVIDVHAVELGNEGVADGIGAGAGARARGISSVGGLRRTSGSVSFRLGFGFGIGLGSSICSGSGRGRSGGSSSVAGAVGGGRGSGSVSGNGTASLARHLLEFLLQAVGRIFLAAGGLEYLCDADPFVGFEAFFDFAFGVEETGFLFCMSSITSPGIDSGRS